jgi:predicted dehydrogenase
LEERIIGDLLHFSGEAYGPVIVKPKTGNWRASSSEGGGCLNDYASHVINLIQEIVGRPAQVKGTMLKKFYSKEVEDGVFSNLILDGGLTGTLSVNWSDETYRKMSTSLMVFGTEGKIICDATELKVYLKKESKKHNYPKGWTIKYVTDLTKEVDFYLRGEEYSSQLDYFVDSIINGTSGGTNTFEQALYTDKVIEMLKSDA